MAAALELSIAELDAVTKHVAGLSDRLTSGILERIRTARESHATRGHPVRARLTRCGTAVKALLQYISSVTRPKKEQRHETLLGTAGRLRVLRYGQCW